MFATHDFLNYYYLLLMIETLSLIQTEENKIFATIQKFQNIQGLW